MNILVILPNWLGDAIMATPAIELLDKHYDDVKFTFVGSFVSIEALKHHPKCVKAVVDDTKKSKNRFVATRELAKSLGSFDLAITFRNQLHSSLLLSYTNSKLTLAKRSWHSMFLVDKTPLIKDGVHLCLQYAKLAMSGIKEWDGDAPKLKLYIKPKVFEKPTLGLNAGATYGSAKRWYPDRFALVAKEFAQSYDIVIFGGPNETMMAGEIGKYLVDFGVKNYINLAGKTTIEELCSYIGGLSLFVTNDSGPMHIAAAYGVPSVAIFGPTKHYETSQWKNEKSSIVRHDMYCSPCMKRECPLGHHECMKSIEALEVVEALKPLSKSLSSQ